MDWFVLQLRALRDGGLDYTLDDLIESMDTSRGRMASLSNKELPYDFSDVIERLQMIVNRRARKAA